MQEPGYATEEHDTVIAREGETEGTYLAQIADNSASSDRISVPRASEEDLKREAEYKEAGIAKDPNTGTWLCNGRTIHMLVDEDGSVKGAKERRRRRKPFRRMRKTERQILHAALLDKQSCFC